MKHSIRKAAFALTISALALTANTAMAQKGGPAPSAPSVPVIPGVPTGKGTPPPSVPGQSPAMKACNEAAKSSLQNQKNVTINILNKWNASGKVNMKWSPVVGGGWNYSPSFFYTESASSNPITNTPLQQMSTIMNSVSYNSANGLATWVTVDFGRAVCVDRGNQGIMGVYDKFTASYGYSN